MKKNCKKCFYCESTVLIKDRQLEKFNLYKCLKCGLLMTDLPANFNFQKVNNIFYSKSYVHNYLLRTEYLKRRFRKRVRGIEKLKHGGRLLDVGCSVGLFLETLKEESKYSWESYGIEANAGNVRVARQRTDSKIYKGILKRNKFPDDFFDCITCFDVLEHDVDLKENLNEIFRILKKKGIIVIQTPNYKSLMAYLCGSNWDWWAVPDHVLHFSPESLKSILIDQSFRIQKLFTWEPREDFVSNLRGSIVKVVRQFSLFSKLISKACILPVYLLSVTSSLLEGVVHIGGLVVVFATKD